MSKMTARMTTQKQVRNEFKAWALENGLSLRRIEGGGFCCDTRCAFVDYVDGLARNGEISNELAQRVTLD